MRILFLLISISIVCNSCNKNGGDAGTAHQAITIHYIDSGGMDLFSFSNDGVNGYWMDSIQVYDIGNGTKNPLACYNNNTTGYMFQSLNVLRTTICPNLNIKNRYSYTLIHLKSGMDDTIKVHINTDQISPSTNNDSIWYNRTLKTYDSTGNITVIK